MMKPWSRPSIAPAILAFVAALAFTVALKPPIIYFYIVGGVVLLSVLFLAVPNQTEFRIKEMWWSVIVCLLLGSLLGHFFTQ